MVHELHRTIEACQSAIHTCCAASASDPNWFTLDVQDSHKRRIQMLQAVIGEIDISPLAEPPGVSGAEKVKGAVFLGYAKTANFAKGLFGLGSPSVTNGQQPVNNGYASQNLQASQASAASAPTGTSSSSSSGNRSSDGASSASQPQVGPHFVGPQNTEQAQHSSQTRTHGGGHRTALDVSDPMLAKVWARVCDDSDPIKWVVFGYGAKDCLSCIASGTGGREELLSWVKDDAVSWVGFRSQSDRLYRLFFVGTRVDGLTRSRAVVHKNAGLAAFVGSQQDVAVADEREELEGCFDFIDF